MRHHAGSDPPSGPLEIDSAGTHGYHLGHPPDRRAIRTASKWGVDISDLRARRVNPEDFSAYDLIVAMDEANLEHLRQLHANAMADSMRAELRLMMDFSPRRQDLREVPDPYYGSARDFENMCELLDEATRGLLDWVRRHAPDGDRDGAEKA